MEKYSVILDDFEIKMASSCKHFQQVDLFNLFTLITSTVTLKWFLIIILINQKLIILVLSITCDIYFKIILINS